MKCLRLLAPALLLVGVSLAPVRAQLVHLAFTEGQQNNMIFRADSAMIPWNHTGGYISRFDLWYDVANPTDPTRNVWRADVFAYGLGDFEIVRPHTGLSFAYGNLTLNYWTQSGPWESLEFTAEIPGDESENPGLPVPPFSINAYSLYLAGGSSYFDVPHFGEGYGNGAFNRVTITTEQEVVLHAVPEPSSYAIAGVALLGMAVWLRRRRSLAAHPRSE